MNIERYASFIGSITGADPNSQTFQHPDWQRRQRRNKSPDSIVEEDVFDIASQPGDRLLSEAAQACLGSAISFNQTQEAFLTKVAESLRRMGELSVLVRTDAESDEDRQAHQNEFSHLQDEIRDIGTKLGQAADLFQSTTREAGSGVQMELPIELADPLHHWLEASFDPDRTAISNATAASIAEGNIEKLLATVTDLRTKVELNLHRLNRTILELPLQPNDANRGPQIQNVNGAEESTRSLSNNILVESGTAMLAQANALPQSALRLLGG